MEQERISPIRNKADILTVEQAEAILSGAHTTTIEQFNYIQDVVIDTLLHAGYTGDDIQQWYDFGVLPYKQD